jgi:hypothetical protein
MLERFCLRFSYLRSVSSCNIDSKAVLPLTELELLSLIRRPASIERLKNYITQSALGNEMNLVRIPPASNITLANLFDHDMRITCKKG